ncbi:MAG: response regulator [Deltaproteobacteria bacterium]|nr:response regulator [Deltaproteobacteria bacterium]
MPETRPRFAVVLEPLAPAFLKAEEVVSAFFASRVDSIEEGKIEILGERYVLVRAAALSVEFFSLVEGLYGPGREDEANRFALNILFDLAHSVGGSDARRFISSMQLQEKDERFSAGPIHFAHTGWARVRLLPESILSDDDDFCLVYDHENSFEADAWRASGRQPGFSVCIMNAGYSSGWVEEVQGRPLVASEVSCRAKGDEACRFVMARPDRIEGRIAQFFPRDRAERTSGLHQVPDFFARKRIEEELQASQRDLESRVVARTAELADANARLKLEIEGRREVEEKLRQAARLEAIGRLAGGIAHDFNNLLTAITGYTDLALLSLSPTHEARANVEEVARAAELAAALTQKLLALSRGQVLAPERLDVNDVLRALMSLLARLIHEDLELISELSRAPLVVRADRAQLEQAIVNLVVNARDAIREGPRRSGRITLTTRAAQVPDGHLASDGPMTGGTYAVISVKDDGGGMDEATRVHIFEPFFTTKSQGTGLGLAMVYGFVKQSGGALEVESELGAGSDFRILLKKLDEDPVETPPPTQAPSTRGVESVLLVEDETFVRTLAARVLESYGYKVSVAGDPEEGLMLANRLGDELSLLVTDVVMPKLGGKELAERIRLARPDLRVLYVSGYTDQEIVDQTALLPGESFLPKPFTPVKLAEAVRRALDAGQTSPPVAK